MPFFSTEQKMMQNSQDKLSVKETNYMPLFKAFTNCFWHNICKVNCLKWYQIVHHLSQSRMVFIGGQNFSLFIYQLSLLLNYWLLLLSGTTAATTCYWPDYCRLRSSNWLYVAYQCKTNIAFIIDPLHKWRLNLNNNTSYILSLTFMFQGKEIFT